MLKSDMPYDYYDKDSMVPKWAIRDDGRTWVPLFKSKDVAKYFNDYRIGVYKMEDEKWHFELQTSSDVWVPDFESKTFETGLESDDSNESKYYLIADWKDFCGVAVVFVPNKKGLDVDLEWFNFEVEELNPRLTYLGRARKQLRSTAEFKQHSQVELRRLEKDKSDTLHQQCLDFILRRPNALPLLKRLHDVYYLYVSDEKEQTQHVLAYALVTVHDRSHIGNHVCAQTLVSCTETFEPAHQLLVLLSDRFKLPAIPSSIVDEPYWHAHANDLIAQGINCWGWEYQDFLRTHVKGFDKFLVKEVVPTHHLFMLQQS